LPKGEDRDKGENKEHLKEEERIRSLFRMEMLNRNKVPSSIKSVYYLI
jgi:hypothetical protein